MASPTRHYPEDRAGLIPTHLLEYSRPPVESTPLQIQNSSAQDVSTLPEKCETFSPPSCNAFSFAWISSLKKMRLSGLIVVALFQ